MIQFKLKIQNNIFQIFILVFTRKSYSSIYILSNKL